MDKNNCYKKCSLFSFLSPNLSVLQFYLRFLYELKHKVHLSKTVCESFHFRFQFVFIKVYIFVQEKAWTLWLENIISPFKIKIIEKPGSFFSLRVLIFKLQQEALKFSDIYVSWSSALQKLTKRRIF